MPDASTISLERVHRSPASGRPHADVEPELFDAAVRAAFPLPLTTFEKYMLWDDRPDYPMAFVVQLKLRGEVDREALMAAVNDALASHPLLCSLVKKRPRGGPVWVLAAACRPGVRWGVLGDPIGHPLGAWIDLESEVGLRVWAHQGVERAGMERGRDTVEMTFQFHHACCDGSGALRFIGDLLAAYGIRTAPAGRRPVLRACDPGQLTARGHVATRSSSARLRPAGFWTSLRESVLWLLRRPAALRARGDDPRDASRDRFFDSADWHTFDHADARSIRRAAMRWGVTMNDLLLRDMFQTLHQWNAEPDRRGGRQDDRAYVRITVPVSTNTGSKGHRSAANSVSYSFLTRRGRECTDPDSLLQGLVRENDGPTRRRRAKAFLRIFHLLEAVPGLIPWIMGADRCFATAVFSNLGDIARHFGAEFPLDEGRIVAGTLVLDEILGFPPIRPRTRAAFMVGRYAGRCRVCVRCDPTAFTAADVRGLLASYIDRLRAAMETG